jgi:hypothetical protein
MSQSEAGPPGDPGAPGSGPEEAPGGAAPSQEELRARIEEQLRNVGVQDLMVESVVSILNLTARRIAKEDERDLEQARLGIEAVRAWVELLPEDAAGQVQQALSELQMLYAREAGGGGEEPPEGGEQKPEESGQPPQQPPPRRPPGGEPPPRLWTPGSG